MMSMYGGSYDKQEASSKLPRVDKEGMGFANIDAIRVVQSGTGDTYHVVEGEIETFPGYDAGTKVCLSIQAFRGKFGSNLGRIKGIMEACFGRRHTEAEAGIASGPDQPLRGRRVGIQVSSKIGKQSGKEYMEITLFPGEAAAGPVSGTAGTLQPAPAASAPPPAPAPALNWFPLSGDPRGNQYAQDASGAYHFRTV